MTLALLVVDPSTNEAEERACAGIAALWDGPLRVARPALDGPADVGELSGLAALILLGSASSVHDESPWKAALESRLLPVLAGELRLPLFGICYGHQLVAKLAGAAVVPSAGGEKLLGIRTIAVEAACPLFDPRWRTFQAAISHREMVDGLPAGYCRIATHAECANHGMQHEALPIYTLQSHPELPPASFARLGYAGPENPVRIEHGREILARFLALAAG